MMVGLAFVPLFIYTGFELGVMIAWSGQWLYKHALVGYERIDGSEFLKPVFEKLCT